MLEFQSVSYEVASRVVLREISCSLKSRKYGLVGANGTGKSTLARLLVGAIEPTSGRVKRDLAVAYLAQSQERPAGVCGDWITDVWSQAPRDVEVVAGLLQPLEPLRPITSLSGGEWMRLRLAMALASSPPFLILDEPTNDLDRDGREVVLRLVRQFTEGLVVISHDRELLTLVDEILELTPRGLVHYGGGFNLFWRERNAAQKRQRDALARARIDVRTTAREQQAKLERQDHRQRAGQRKFEQGGMSRILAGGQKRRAEVTRGKLLHQADASIEAAREELRAARDALESDPFMRLDFESEAPPPSRPFFEAQDLNLRFQASAEDLWPAGLSFLMCGRQRWHIRGGNGAGKSTLLRLLMGQQPGPTSGVLWRSDRPLLYLDQGLTLLDDQRSVLENIGADSRFPPVALRNELAFYGFKGDSVHQIAGTMSGGERMRAALARSFLGPAIPQVVILDEPTNNLDLQSLELLETALSRFMGLLVIVSHDSHFVDQLGVTDVIDVS